MKKVDVAFDTNHETWNVMLNERCIYWTKDVREVDIWLNENEGRYYEG